MKPLTKLNREQAILMAQCQADAHGKPFVAYFSRSESTDRRYRRSPQVDVWLTRALGYWNLIKQNRRDHIIVYPNPK